MRLVLGVEVQLWSSTLYFVHYGHVQHFSSLIGHFGIMKRHGHSNLAIIKTLVASHKITKTFVMKVNVWAILLAATANFSGVHGQIIKVSQREKANHI
jgi:hypothetical protein